MRKTIAGLLIGLLSAVVVLTADALFDTIGGGTAVNPLLKIELITRARQANRKQQQQQQRPQ